MIAFKPDVEEIKTARDHVAEIAAEWPVDDYTVRMVVSELVTNAVRHACTDEVRVDAYADDGAYVVEVWDGDETVPVVGRPGRDALSGRGLMIVGELVARWGTVRDEGKGGKVVFAEWKAPAPHMTARRSDVQRDGTP
ncbi:ATP-binding protein [Actinomadura sp. KC216]|uniref:ATP-binding protein n=1 Tax=Actinomadura sp. KC216 TaxID=2530370 RepID=UPI001046A06D|nr:ATP-binding protein [Actinomadura sp. KC216]TDB79592.1 ATP-binding protein [Actinomadura sp. KC216]